MYAIIQVGSQQIKVTPGSEVILNRVEGSEGESVEFDVILASDGSKTAVGTPVLPSKIQGKILEHLKDDKVIIFKKKRRKGYRVKNGHRQAISRVLINTEYTF